MAAARSDWTVRSSVSSSSSSILGLLVGSFLPGAFLGFFGAGAVAVSVSAGDAAAEPVWETDLEAVAGFLERGLGLVAVVARVAAAVSLSGGDGAAVPVWETDLAAAFFFRRDLGFA